MTKNTQSTKPTNNNPNIYRYFSIHQYLLDQNKPNTNFQKSSEKRIIPKQSKNLFKETIVHWFQPLSNTAKTKILQYNNISINNDQPFIREVDFSTTPLIKAA